MKEFNGEIGSVKGGRKISLAKGQQTILLFLNKGGEEEKLIAFDERFFRKTKDEKLEEGKRVENFEILETTVLRLVWSFRIGGVSQTSDYSFQNGAI